jgi:MFS family permease
VYIANVFSTTYQHVQTFHPAFGVVCAIAFCFYGALIPFNNIASDFLQYKYYPDDGFTASFVMSIPDTLSIFLVPFVGCLVDKYGQKLRFLTIGGICMTLGHFLLGFTLISPKIALCFNGISNSGLVVLWSWIPNLVEEPCWATAYGIVTICINAAYTLVPLLVAHSLSLDPTYRSSQSLFMLLTCIGTMFCLMLRRWNHQENLGLNASEEDSMVGHGVEKSHLVELSPNMPLEDGTSEEFLFS